MTRPGRGRLYVVATPIGNLGDLSRRAIDTLAEADLIAAEDTRTLRKLLSHAGISGKRMLAYHDANESRQSGALIARLKEGLSVALVSEAGTPVVSDPGHRLVEAAAAEGIEVSPVPGPSAVTALVSVAGLGGDGFVFEGFLPRAATARRHRLAAMKGSGRTHVLFEAPGRLLVLLGAIETELDDPELVVGRELTKLHEEVLRGTASGVAGELAERERVRGECVVAFHCLATDSGEGVDVDSELAALLGVGLSVRDAARVLGLRGVDRKKVYAAARRMGRGS